MSKFQIILTSIFVICIVIGVIMFATYKGKGDSNTLPTVTIWGSYPSGKFYDFLQKYSNSSQINLSVQYTEISKSNFRTNLIEQLAKGSGPDAILVSQQELLGLKDKIVEIPNKLLSQRDFQNTFISEADLYITPTGSLGLPFILDPLVMYWNKTIFTNAGIAKYPQYWDEFSDIGQRITIKDQNDNIRRSTIAMGEFSNVNHAREILSALLFQSGNPITYNSGESYVSGLGDGNFAGSKFSVPALQFYTQFSDPRNSKYSWNRSLPNSKTAFIAGNLAVYFGFASEINDIREKNPNLNYDAALLPQARKGSIKATYGDMYGFSIIKTSSNPTNTYNIMNMLTSAKAQEILMQVSYLPSTRRDMIAHGSTDPYMSIFLDSSLISRGWLDTSIQRSNQIFTDMVESITSGRLDTYSAVNKANDELNLSLRNI